MKQVRYRGSGEVYMNRFSIIAALVALAIFVTFLMFLTTLITACIGIGSYLLRVDYLYPCRVHFVLQWIDGDGR
jgi:hypothetical protein